VIGCVISAVLQIPYILAYKSVFWEFNFGPKVYVRLIGEISEDWYFSERLGVVFSCFKNRSKSVFQKYFDKVHNSNNGMWFVEKMALMLNIDVALRYFNKMQVKLIRAMV
jgi:hypothetical protein